MDFKDIDERRRKDAIAFNHTMDDDLCMLCFARGTDKRGLFIDCFYSVTEVVPEALDITDAGCPRGTGYYLKICKACRGDLIARMKSWRDTRVTLRSIAKDSDGNIS